MDITEEVIRLQENVKTLQSDVTSIKATLVGQDDKLDVLVADRNRRKGARAMTKALLSLVGSGGFIGWLWEHFHK